MRHRADSQPTSQRLTGTASDLPDDAILALQQRSNMLIVGGAAETRVLLGRLRASLSMPTYNWKGGRLVLPPITVRCTMVLSNVEMLPVRDQRRLEAWFEDGHGAAQVISTTTRPLHSLVLEGAFLDRLYYHLNTILIELPASGQKSDDIDSRSHSEAGPVRGDACTIRNRTISSRRSSLSDTRAAVRPTRSV
jgi:hypothetical protein